MNLVDPVLLLIAAAGAAGLGSALGMAGGIFIVPVMTTFLHTPFPVAVAVSLVSVIACSCASSPQFLSAGLANLRLAVVLEIATVTGALAGVALVGTLDDRVLYLIFAVVMAVSAWQMLAGRRARPVAAPPSARDWGTRLRLHSSYPADSGGEENYHVRRVPLGMSLMFGAGLLSALLGIGSGVLKIPAMDSALRLPVKVSSATANLMIGVTACGSALAYLVRGDVQLDLAAPVLLGSVIGAVLGARLLVRLPSGGLRVLFVTVLAALAVAMAAQALGVHL